MPPWAVVVHRVRTSGKEYRTPVAAFVRGGIVAVALPHGGGADWVRNLLAAGGGELIRLGRARALVNPRVVDRGKGGIASRATRRTLLADLV